MAKKGLKRPDLPAGERSKFFVELQRVALENGDPSVAKLAAALGFSHQTIYKALTGPKMPSRRVVVALAEFLGDQRSAKELVALWSSGVAEERQLIGSPAKSADIQGNPSESTGSRTDLHEILRNAYEESGVKMTYIAEEAAMSRSLAYDVVAGRSFPEWYIVRRLVRRLRLDPEELEPLYQAARAEHRRRARGTERFARTRAAK